MATTDTLLDQPPAGTWFTPGEPYWAHIPDGPKYGELRWDLRPATVRTNYNIRTLDLTDIPTGYLRTAADLLMLLTQPDHPNVVTAGIVRRADPAPASIVYESGRMLRMMARWGQDRGLWCFSAWTQSDADALLEDMVHGLHRTGGAGMKPHSASRVVTLLKELHNARGILAEPLTFQPWGERTASDVTDASRPPENETPPLPWTTWAPLLAASWAFVDRFSPDIIAAHEARENVATEPTGPTADAALERFQAWVAAGGRVPLATGLSRDPAERGRLNKSLLARQVGIGSAALNPAASGFNPRLAGLVDQMAADPDRRVLGGLIDPAVTVTQPDGTQAPWVSEIGSRESLYLDPMLRAACYVVIAALTGMRDSEIQSLTRGAVTTSNGLPALSSVQHKGRGTAGESRTWWAPAPVLRAVEVLEQLAPHPRYLFARSADFMTGYQVRRDLGYLIRFVNANPAERIGKGADLSLARIELTKGRWVNATSLRRSFAVYSTTRPGAELGLGIQLGHAAWRMTSGYTSDAKQVAVRHLDERRRTLLRDQAAELLTGGDNLAGPAARALEGFRAQVVADPGRADKLTDRLAGQIHYGLTNDCLWNPEASACGADRPKLADHLCAGGDCSNALFGPAHVNVLTDALERFDAFLDTPAAKNPQLRERMGADRAKVARVLRDLQPPPHPGHDT